MLLKREKVLRNINISRILEIFCSLAPHGASGLKSEASENESWELGLAPHGASGLKYTQIFVRQI